MRPLVYAGRSGCGDSLGSPNGPHQVAQAPFGAETAHYHYDVRGNQTLRDLPGTANDRTIRYSADNRAHEIALGNGVRTRFWYGSDGQRYKREEGGRRTLYLGNVEVVIDGGVTTLRRTVAGVAVQTLVGSAVSTRHLFHDRLGSVVVATHPQGTVAERFDYQPFGGRRDPANPDAAATQASNITPRGFTGHEMLDGVGVIHMNGRIYDPQLGRFLQPDPVIQAPFDPQSWNAYTYVFNNPLAYTDPSGMIGIKERQWAAGIIAITAAAFGQYYISQGAYAAAFAVTTSGAFASGAVATQSFKGGVYGTFGAALTFGVGAGLDGWRAVLGYAVSGGIVESLQGGNFGNGFAAASVTALVMPGVHGIGNPVARATVGALVGGSLSELSGGKFANGAVSGAVQAAMAGAKSRRGTTRDQLASYAEQARYDPETALAVNPEASDFRSIRLTQQWADGEISDAQYREIMCNYCSDPILQKVGIYGTAAVATFGVALEYEAIAAGSLALWKGGQHVWRNIEFDGPSAGAWHANGRIIGMRWKKGAWGVRLDLHPMKGDPTNTPVLHLNAGPLGRGEASHIPVFDPRWLRNGK